MENKRAVTPVMLAILAAALFSAAAPVSKALLDKIEPTPLASLMYLGCGAGVLFYKLIRMFFQRNAQQEARLEKKDIPWMLGVIAAGGVAAPVVLMYSLQSTPAATASLLLQFEAVSTALIAAFFFKEPLGKRVWLSIGLITAASAVLSFNPSGEWGLSAGALGILSACVLWGLDNNFTRNVSAKDPLTITACKGLGAGVVSLALALMLRSGFPALGPMLLALLLGALSYGVSIVLFVLSMRSLGAARASAFFGTAPFIGSLLSVVIFGESPSLQLLLSLPLMAVGAILIAGEYHMHAHLHEALTHDHKHCHDDAHHNHTHADGFLGEHAHPHTHEQLLHAHLHAPDIHHRHGHDK